MAISNALMTKGDANATSITGSEDNPTGFGNSGLKNVLRHCGGHFNGGGYAQDL